MKIHVPFQPILEITALDECMNANFRHPYYFPGEFHPFWELVYVLDGKMQVAIGKDIYTMHKGDIVLYKPMEFHRLWTVDNTDIHAFVVGFSAKGDMLSVLESGTYVLTNEQQMEIEALFHYLHTFTPKDKTHLLQQMAKQWNENIAQIHRFINNLENFLISLATQPRTLTQKTVAESSQAQSYCSIVAELNAHIRSWITTEDIAAKLHCSPAQVNRIFARYSDIGVHKYLIKLKIATAIQMLRDDIPISEISAQLAFSNQNYFSSVFKRETGFSPSQYLKQNTDAISLL